MFVSSGAGSRSRARRSRRTWRGCGTASSARRKPRARPMRPACPLASTTNRARSVRSAPVSSRTRTPIARSRSNSTSSTRHPSWTSTPLARAVVEQDLVELRSPHLERRRDVCVRLAEVPAPGLRRGAPDHRRAALRQKARGFDRRHARPAPSRMGMLAGSSDSPTCSRGTAPVRTAPRSRPCRASIVAAVLPAGPPPTTMTSAIGPLCEPGSPCVTSPTPSLRRSPR